MYSNQGKTISVNLNHFLLILLRSVLDAEPWCSDSMYPLSPRSSFFGPPCSCFSMDLYQLDLFYFILFLIYFNVDFEATFFFFFFFFFFNVRGAALFVKPHFHLCSHFPTL
ncbi:unnamed protein product, partial [Penicillium nalgiovense]